MEQTKCEARIQNDLLANQSEAEREKCYVTSDRLLWVVVVIIGAFIVWLVHYHGHEQNLCLNRRIFWLVMCDENVMGNRKKVRWTK
jgi:hypothetical protein